MKVRIPNCAAGTCVLRAAACLATMIFAIDAYAQAPSSGQVSGTCLQMHDIRNTEVLNDRTILFHMLDGKTWKNSLPHRCPGLNFNGFSYAPKMNRICDNLEHIRVLRTGETCLLGEFTPYMPAPKPRSDTSPN